MKRNSCLMVLLLFAGLLRATAQELSTNMERQLEWQAEDKESEPEQDDWMQQLSELQRKPINIRTAGREEWRQLPMLSDWHIDQLLLYQSALGELTSLYELQAVPGWTTALIQSLLPFVYYESEGFSFTTNSWRKSAEQQLLLRVRRVLQPASGWLRPDSLNGYQGGRQQWLLRYRISLGAQWHLGFLAEQDAGEPFGKAGFDGYNGYLHYRGNKKLKQLLLGSYAVNMGQGLQIWQSLTLQGADVAALKWQAPAIRPFGSPTESGFTTGVAAEWGTKHWSVMLFGGRNRLDANLSTNAPGQTIVTSLQASGYHRNNSELADKDVLRRHVAGGQLVWRRQQLQLGVGGVYTAFNIPLQRKNEPYNQFLWTGKQWLTVGVSGSYTWRNSHWFGEWAVDQSLHKAMIVGTQWAFHRHLAFGLKWRRVDAAFASPLGAADMQNATVNNESGWLAMLQTKLANGLSLQFITDVFRFSALKYRVNGPSQGHHYALMLRFQPNKQTMAYLQWRNLEKGWNEPSDSASILPAVWPANTARWRLHWQHLLQRGQELRFRTETARWRQAQQVERGWLAYVEYLYTPNRLPFKLGLRVQWFQTDGYNSRIYAYERHVLYYNSIPAFFDVGWRCYANVQYRLTRSLTTWLRYAGTVYRQKQTIGSGLDEIQGSRRDELTLQLRWLF